MTAKKKAKRPKPPAPAGRRVSKAELRRWMGRLDQIDLEASFVCANVAALKAAMAKARSK